MLLKTLPANTDGRDFVIGDIHGHYDFVISLLEHVDFDFTKDRLISVGDLIDRGPDSLKCIQLLGNDWFHAVRGNHEEMALEAVFGGPENANSEYLWLQNGGEWYIKAAHDPYVEDYVKSLSKLPHVITVQGLSMYHVLHAQLDKEDGDPLTDRDLADLATLERVALKTPTYDGAVVLWGRLIFRTLHGKNLLTDGGYKHIEKFISTCKYHKLTDWMSPALLSPIYCGHTPIFNPVKVNKLINLDTGVFISTRDKDNRYGLTMTQIGTSDYWKINNSGITKVSLIEITV